MNQINLDALLQIGSGRTQPILQSLKLTPDTLYQALLNIGSDGAGQLHVATPQGPVQIQLTPQQTALLLQATPQSPAALQNQALANQATATQVTLNGQLQGQLVGQVAGQQSGTPLSQQPGQQLGQSSVQLSGQLSGQISGQGSGQQLPVGNQPSPAANKPLPLQLLLQPGTQGLLQIQTQPAPVQIPLQPSQLLQLLGSQQQQPLTIPVQLQRLQQQLILTLPNQQQLQLPASWIEGAADWPAQQPKLAQLTVQLVQGQLKISVTLQDAPAERTQPSAGQSSAGQVSAGQSSAGTGKPSATQQHTIAPLNTTLPDKPAASATTPQTAATSATPNQARIKARIKAQNHSCLPLHKPPRYCRCWLKHCNLVRFRSTTANYSLANWNCLIPTPKPLHCQIGNCRRCRSPEKRRPGNYN